MIVIEERIICRMLEGLFQFDKECEWNDAIEEAMHRFVNLPTIDAVPVVRCKDCRWSRGFATFACPMVGRINLKDDDFCSRGERRADERSD